MSLTTMTIMSDIHGIIADDNGYGCDEANVL